MSKVGHVERLTLPGVWFPVGVQGLVMHTVCAYLLVHLAVLHVFPSWTWISVPLSTARVGACIGFLERLGKEEGEGEEGDNGEERGDGKEGVKKKEKGGRAEERWRRTGGGGGGRGWRGGGGRWRRGGEGRKDKGGGEVESREGKGEGGGRR